jgi:hypothetical protein
MYYVAEQIILGSQEGFRSMVLFTDYTRGIECTYFIESEY